MKKTVAILSALILLVGGLFGVNMMATAAGEPTATLAVSSVAKGGYVPVVVKDLNIPRIGNQEYCSTYQEVYHQAAGKRYWHGSTDKPVLNWSYVENHDPGTYSGLKLRIRISCDGRLPDFERDIPLGNLTVSSGAAISLSATNLQPNQKYEARLTNFPDGEVAEVKISASNGTEFPNLTQHVTIGNTGLGLAELNTAGLAKGAYIMLVTGPTSGTRSLSFSISGGTVEPATIPFTRISGSSAIDTAVAISKSTNWATGKTVYLVNQFGFQDALAAGPAAFMGEGPLLLVDRESLPPQTWAELVRLQPKTVRLLGGKFAISEALEAEINTKLATAYTPAPMVERVRGATSEATAVEVSKKAFTSASTAFLGTSMSYPDALSAGPMAAQMRSPLLLTSGTLAPEVLPELRRLGVSKVYLLGGNRAITPAVESTLKAAGLNIQRLAGGSALQTSYVVNKTLAQPSQFEHVYWATSLDFADGLAATPLVAKNQSVLMLSGPGCVDPVARFVVLKQTTSMTLLGGGSAVPQSVGQLIPCS